MASYGCGVAGCEAKGKSSRKPRGSHGISCRGSEMALDRLRASLAESPIVRFGEYEYFVHPITDGIPLGRPEVLDEVLSELVRIGDWNRCDEIADILIVFEKTREKARMEKELGVRIKTLLKVDVVRGRLVERA